MLVRSKKNPCVANDLSSPHPSFPFPIFLFLSFPFPPLPYPRRTTQHTGKERHMSDGNPRRRNDLATEKEPRRRNILPPLPGNSTWRAGKLKMRLNKIKEGQIEFPPAARHTPGEIKQEQTGETIRPQPIARRGRRGGEGGASCFSGRRLCLPKGLPPPAALP